MSGLEGVSLLVVVMDRGLLGLLLCLVVMCVAGAVGAALRGDSPPDTGEPEHV